MYTYALRRLLLAIPVLLLSSVIVFGLMRVMPGDALTALMAESGNVSERELQKLRKDLGLDRPYHEQYLLWVWQMVTFNPGYSIFTSEPIPVALKKAIPVTIELALLGMGMGLLIAIPCLSAFTILRGRVDLYMQRSAVAIDQVMLALKRKPGPPAARPAKAPQLVG